MGNRKVQIANLEDDTSHNERVKEYSKNQLDK